MNRYVFILPLTFDDFDDHSKKSCQESLKIFLQNSSFSYNSNLVSGLLDKVPPQNLVQTAILNDANKKTEWVEYISDRFEESFYEMCHHFQDNSGNQYGNIYEKIHNLADLLPIYSSCFVDVVIIMRGKSVNLESNFELYGSLLRLYTWHNAQIHIMRSEDVDITVWEDLLCAIEFQPRKLSEVWRGSISLDVKEEGYMLPSFAIYSTLPEDEIFSPTKKEQQIQQSKLNHSPIFGPMQLVAEYRRITVPEYIISNKSFILNLRCTAESTQDSQQFLDHVAGNAQMCYLFRIPYAASESIHRLADNYKANDWKKCSHKYNPPKIIDKLSNQEFLFFLLLKDGPTSKSCQLFLIHNPSELDASVLLPSSSCSAELSNCNVDGELENLPIMSHELYSRLRDQFCKHIITPSAKDIDTMHQSNVLKQFFSDLISNINVSKTLANIGSNDKNSEKPATEIDASDWPERKALLHQAMIKDKFKRLSSLDSLAGIDPPTSNCLTIPLVAEEFLKYFEESGEPKSEVSRKSSKFNALNRKKICPSVFCDTSSDQSWPDVLKQTCHDTYYNIDNETEEIQQKFDNLKKRLLTEETASTCSFDINQSKKYISIKKDPVPNIKQKADISHSAPNIRRSPRKHFKSITSLNKSMRQRSPRKVISQKQRLNSKISSSKSVTDKHIMKLRCCVFEALEKNGIPTLHKSFKSCGKKLFAVCKPFLQDIIGVGRTSLEMQKICDSHVKQVIEFELKRLKY